MMQESDMVGAARTFAAGMLKQVEMDNHAVVMCGVLLGRCYVMQEIIDSYMTECYAYFRKQPWFRHSLKMNLNKARMVLGENLKSSRQNSEGNSMIMMDCSDFVCAGVDNDIYKMQMGAENNLNRIGVENSRSLVMLVILDMMMRYTRNMYRGIMGYMHDVHEHNYEEMYVTSSCENVLLWFNKALKEYCDKYVHVDIDLNKMPSPHHHA